MDSYRTLSSFETHMRSTVNFTNCATTPLSSGVVVDSSSDGSDIKFRNFLVFAPSCTPSSFNVCWYSLLKVYYVSCFLQDGKFAGGNNTMYYSKVVIGNSSSNGLTGTATLHLDEREVRLYAGTLKGSIASEYTVTMFVGMAR